MSEPAGLIAIRGEMARQQADALASFTAGAAVAGDLAASLRQTGRLLMLGMGASHAVNRAVEPLYRDLGLDALALPVSEQLGAGLPLAGRTVLLASQSGESAEVVRWLADGRQEAAPLPVFGMTLDGGSTLGRAVPCLVAEGGAELAFAATRSLTLTLALHLAVLAALGEDPEPALAVLRADAGSDTAAAVDALAGVGAMLCTGRRLQGLAEAAALGLCELSRQPAFALEGGQARHGPMEILGPGLGVLALRSDEAEAALVGAYALAAAEAGSPVVLLDCSGLPPVPGVTTLTLPPAGGMAAILTLLPAIQSLMLGHAAARVADVGTPRRSSKITRTEC